MPGTVKTAISLPREVFRLVESLRKKTGKSRSRILVEAFHAWMASRQEEELDKRYEDAYRKKPEKLSELESFLKASAPVWGKEKWVLPDRSHRGDD